MGDSWVALRSRCDNILGIDSVVGVVMLNGIVEYMPVSVALRYSCNLRMRVDGFVGYLPLPSVAYPLLDLAWDADRRLLYWMGYEYSLQYGLRGFDIDSHVLCIHSDTTMEVYNGRVRGIRSGRPFCYKARRRATLRDFIFG